MADFNDVRFIQAVLADHATGRQVLVRVSVGDGWGLFVALTIALRSPLLEAENRAIVLNIARSLAYELSTSAAAAGVIAEALRSVGIVER